MAPQRGWSTGRPAPLPDGIEQIIPATWTMDDTVRP
jgi:hypothetical protein